MSTDLLVHVTLCAGALVLVGLTSLALLRRVRGSSGGIAAPIAFAGAVLAAGAETWRVYAEAARDASGGPMVEALSVCGSLVVVVAMALWHRTSGRRPAEAGARRPRP